MSADDQDFFSKKYHDNSTNCLYSIFSSNSMLMTQIDGFVLLVSLYKYLENASIFIILGLPLI